MSKFFARWWPEGAALAVLVAFLTAAYFFAAANRYGNFLYHYQTLITGMLAVAAAFITVRQMIFTDREQGVRHQQSLSFAMRSELRSIDRGLRPALARMRKLEVDLAQVVFDYSQDGAAGDPKWRWYSAAAEPLLHVVSELQALIESDPFIKASDYFSGTSIWTLQVVKAHCAAMRGNLRHHIEVTDPAQQSSGDMEYYEAILWDEGGDHKVEQAFEFREKFIQFLWELQKDAAEFDVLKQKFGTIH
ncbi:hypothetical protein N5C66_06465 [Rhizobium pusense]|uniref:hypothetical protein n=1 Tax=Agrobacterium pusense TaxID=648995 RepID=UPI00244B388D|nr:hypothetical protein [Agrobacterium pusense]MDH1094704.1 hypothetical protein [Agrobacterium pusense]MDH1111371.1 hypothetical protein [Agrobacterium pusense]MDH2192684.1 hypothetical protein [Agrobacterium pusense]